MRKGMEERWKRDLFFLFFSILSFCFCFFFSFFILFLWREEESRTLRKRYVYPGRTAVSSCEAPSRCCRWSASGAGVVVVAATTVAADADLMPSVCAKFASSSITDAVSTPCARPAETSLASPAVISVSTLKAGHGKKNEMGKNSIQ